MSSSNRRMLTVADVIFPAFYFPYIAQLMYPLSAVVALSVEYFVYRFLNREQTAARLLMLVIIANAASSVAGIALAATLPSGLNQQFLRSGVGPARDPTWSHLATLSWFVAFGLSIAVEYPIAIGVTRARPLRRPFLSVSLANVASYVALFGALQLSVWLVWHRYR